MSDMEKVIRVLEVTASNIRSVGPAGALEPYVPFRPWLELVENMLSELMPDWPNHLTDVERAKLAEIDQRLAADNAERRRLMNLAKQRKHRKQA